MRCMAAQYHTEVSDPAQPSFSPRIMGLDVGDRRIGVALSDLLGIAQPLLTVTRTNRRQDLRFLVRLIRKHACAAIVIGNPLYMSGDLSPQAAKVHAFTDLLRAEVDLPIHLWDERLTTTEAHRILDATGHDPRDRKGIIDQVAAVLILQSYLDAHAAHPLAIGPNGL